MSRSSQRRLVLAAGMQRSGSTWLYNAARLILSRQEPQVYGCWVDDFDPARSDITPVTIVKIHSIDLGWAERADVILTCHRDLRDVAASMRDMGWADDDNAVKRVTNARTCHEFWSKRADADLAYSLIRERPTDAIVSIAETLETRVSADQARQIAEAIDALSAREPESRYDSVTLLHRQHRRHGARDRWKDSLDPELAQRIADENISWMIKRGYLAAAD